VRALLEKEQDKGVPTAVLEDLFSGDGGCTTTRNVKQRVTHAVDFVTNQTGEAQVNAAEAMLQHQPLRLFPSTLAATSSSSSSSLSSAAAAAAVATTMPRVPIWVGFLSGELQLMDMPMVAVIEDGKIMQAVPSKGLALHQSFARARVDFAHSIVKIWLRAGEQPIVLSMQLSFK